MRTLILIAITYLIMSSAVAQNWQRVGNNYNSFNKTLYLNNGTAVVNFPAGAYNMSWEQVGNNYYAYCYLNGVRYQKPITNISWQQQRTYSQQFQSNWNCQVIAPIGYNYLGYSNNNGNYYTNYWYGGNYYRQQIGVGVASFILNSAAGIINTIQFNNNWNNGFNSWNNNLNQNWRW